MPPQTHKGRMLFTAFKSQVQLMPLPAFKGLPSLPGFRLVYVTISVKRTSHLWGCSPPWPWPALPANARKCTWSRRSREPPRQWRRETEIQSSPPGPELQHSGPEREKENRMRRSLGTPGHDHLHWHNGQWDLLIPGEGWKRRRRWQSWPSNLSDLSATVFFVFLFLQSDFEGMLRMMLTKDCSQPVRPYLDSDISTGQRDGGQVKHLKAAKGYQEKSQASREEDEIMRRGRGLYYCLSQDHKQEWTAELHQGDRNSLIIKTEVKYFKQKYLKN